MPADNSQTRERRSCVETACMRHRRVRTARARPPAGPASKRV